MQIRGYWSAGTPMVNAILRPESGGEVGVALLLDTGAGRTVFDYRVLEMLDFEYDEGGIGLAGVGGEVDAVSVGGRLVFTAADGTPVAVRGPFAAFPDPSGLDLSVLGRDVLGNFAAVVDQPGGVVALVAGDHTYTIHPR